MLRVAVVLIQRGGRQSSMKPKKGRVGVVMPHGVLFRGGAEATIRRCLVENDQLDAVIGLPPNLFYSTTIPACLLVFRSMRPSERRGSVLFIDGSACYVKGKNQNQMGGADIDAIVGAYNGGSGSDAASDAGARLVDHAEIKANDWDLNLTRYVKKDYTESRDVSSALADLAEAQALLRDAEQQLTERLRTAGYA